MAEACEDGNWGLMFEIMLGFIGTMQEAKDCSTWQWNGEFKWQVPGSSGHFPDQTEVTVRFHPTSANFYFSTRNDPEKPEMNNPFPIGEYCSPDGHLFQFMLELASSSLRAGDAGGVQVVILGKSFDWLNVTVKSFIAIFTSIVLYTYNENLGCSSITGRQAQGTN